MAPTECVPSACLLTCLPSCLPACLPAWLPACLPACLLAYLLAYLLACLLASLLACLLACLACHACLLACLYLNPFLSSLELLFNVLLRKVTHGHTHACMCNTPSSRAPVGAKNIVGFKNLHTFVHPHPIQPIIDLLQKTIILISCGTY